MTGQKREKSSQPLSWYLRWFLSIDCNSLWPLICGAGLNSFNYGLQTTRQQQKTYQMESDQISLCSRLFRIAFALFSREFERFTVNTFSAYSIAINCICKIIQRSVTTLIHGKWSKHGFCVPIEGRNILSIIISRGYRGYNQEVVYNMADPTTNCKWYFKVNKTFKSPKSILLRHKLLLRVRIQQLLSYIAVLYSLNFTTHSAR